MIKELRGGIDKKKGQATFMTQVACPYFFLTLLKRIKARSRNGTYLRSPKKE